MIEARRSRRVPLALLLALSTGGLAACGGGDDGGGGSSSGSNSAAGGGSTVAAEGGASTEAAKTAVPDPTSPVTIRFESWIGQDKSIQRMYKAFQKAHPNIKVKFENVPAEEIGQKLTTQVAGGNPPDAAYVDASTVADYAQRGALEDLGDYISRSDVVKTDDFVEAFATSARYKDSYYALPMAGESTGLFYRTDLFQQAGIASPPKTWDEFRTDAEKLTNPAKKQYGTILFAPESAYYWYPWLYQAGGNLLSDDGKEVRFNDEAGKRAAEFYVGLRKFSPPDFLNSNSYDGRVAFANGKVAMYVAGSWFAGVMDDEFPKIKGKWAAAPLPQDKQCGTTIAGDNVVLFSGSKNKDAAWKWLEWLSRPENIKTYTFGSPTSTLLPPRKSMLNNPEIFKQKPILKGFGEAMKCGVQGTTANPSWPKIEQALNDKLGRALYGDLDAGQALDEAAQEAQQIIRRAK